jgi:Protein of unknown function (DUF402)
MPNPVRIHKRKYDGTLAREMTADLVDGSAGGGLAVHLDMRRHQSIANGQPSRFDGHVIGLLSESAPLAWWFMYDTVGRLDHTYVDAALPVTLRGRTIEYVDLDLDLIIQPDWGYVIDDQDEFEVNRLAMAYPDHVIAAAHEGIRLATAAVEARAWPLDGSADLLLGRILAAEGPL